jgi:hypothetical protein
MFGHIKGLVAAAPVNQPTAKLKNVKSAKSCYNLYNELRVRVC